MKNKIKKLPISNNTNFQNLFSQPKTRLKPCIGITFLEKNNFGIKHLFKECKKSINVLEQFYNFLNQARHYDSIGELIKDYISHNHSKNCDEKSKNKMKELETKFNLEAIDIIHLHCAKGGKGSFVLHGFQIGNIFEIIWIDPSHEFFN